jgi:hypothetical protein
MQVMKVVSSNLLGKRRCGNFGHVTLFCGCWKWNKFIVKIEAGIHEGGTSVLKTVVASMLRTLVPNIAVRFRKI